VVGGPSSSSSTGASHASASSQGKSENTLPLFKDQVLVECLILLLSSWFLSSSVYNDRSALVTLQRPGPLTPPTNTTGPQISRSEKSLDANLWLQTLNLVLDLDTYHHDPQSPHSFCQQSAERRKQKPFHELHPYFFD
jgi:hypothetical protein